MDTAQWPQEIVVKPIEDYIVATNSSTYPKPAAAALEKKPIRPQKEQAVNCPRCHSINTKFCYYNNYSLTQPRYFCKTCRRYWTEGGSLRNIPVGGGSRKNKRSNSNFLSSSSSSPSNSTNKNLPDLVTPHPSNLSQNCSQNPKFHQGQDLNLAFPTTNVSASSSSCTSTTTTTATINTTIASTNSQLSALGLLTGITASSSRGLHSFMPVQVPEADPNISTVYSTCGFPLQDFKPTLNFSLDGINGGSGFASLHGTDHVQETSTGRVLFPFEDLKQVSNSSTNPTMDQNNKEQHHQGYSTGYWTGMLGGGSW